LDGKEITERERKYLHALEVRKRPGVHRHVPVFCVLLIYVAVDFQWFSNGGFIVWRVVLMAPFTFLNM
jgi:hypothetical protein